jgi:DNA-binding transcriptional regulator YiaG
MAITKQPAAMERLKARTAALPLRSGRQLAAARTLAGLSQQGLAALGGWHPRTVRLWEAQSGLPTSHLPHLHQLLAILDDHGVTCLAKPIGVHVAGPQDSRFRA